MGYINKNLFLVDRSTQKEGVVHSTQKEGVVHSTQKEGVERSTQKEEVDRSTQKEEGNTKKKELLQQYMLSHSDQIKKNCEKITWINNQPYDKFIKSNNNFILITHSYNNTNNHSTGYINTENISDNNHNTKYKTDPSYGPCVC